MVRIEPKHCENPKNRDKVEKLFNSYFTDEQGFNKHDRELIEGLEKIGENRIVKLYEKYKDYNAVISALNGWKVKIE